MNIGEHIKAYRKIKGLSQVALATKLGKSQSIIEKYEGGRVSPSIDTLIEISQALDISIQQLMSTPPKPNNLPLNGEYSFIGDNIKFFRKLIYLSKSTFASRLNKGLSTVDKYETGQIIPSIPLLYDMAKVLEVSVEQLLSNDGSIINPVDTETTGGKIKLHRKQKNLTQKQLGELINKSEVTVRKYEANSTTPSLSCMKNIARILDVDINDIIG